MKAKQNIIFLFISILLVNLIFINNGFCKPIPFYKEINEATLLVNNDDLIEAITLFQKIQKLLPEHPIGYFYELATLEKLQLDYTSDYREKYFDNLLLIAFSVTDKFIHNNPQDPYGYFFLGGIQGFHGIHDLRVYGRLSAFIDGLKALNNLKKSFSMDSELYDVYYGLGMYTYWKAVKAPFLNFFGFNARDNKEKGITYLKLAIEKGLYSNSEAHDALIRIYMNEKDYENALRMLNEAIKKYPRALFQFRHRANLYFAQQEWQKLYDDCNQLEILLNTKKFSGPDSFVHAYYYKAFSALKLNKNTEAKEYFQKVNDLGKEYSTKITIYKSLLIDAKKFL